MTAVGLRTRLALVGVVTLALTLVVVALLAFQIVRVTGRQSLDRVLRQELVDLRAGLPELVAATGGEDGEVTAEGVTVAVQRYLAVHPGSDQHLVVVRIGAAAFSTRDGPASVLELQEAGDLPEGSPGQLATVSTDAGPVRVLSTALEGRDGEVGTVTIVGPLAEVLGEARRSLLQIAAAGAVGLVVGGAALALATRRALAPLAALVGAARATTGSDDLGARVPEPERRDEIGVLATEFNGMLERIAGDAERRRALLGAISHELRTPLAVAQGHLEIFREAGPRDAEAAVLLAGVVAAELDRLTRIVDDLTAIVRGAQAEGVALGAVFLPDVLAELRERIAGLVLPGVTIAEAPPEVIEADQQRLAQSLLNLVLNAEVHTPPGTAIAVEATVEGDEVVLTVRDDGPGIDEAVRDEVFEPFVTTRPAGSGRTTGLGLAVVRALTDAQGGRVELESGTGGTVARLRFARTSV